MLEIPLAWTARDDIIGSICAKSDMLWEGRALGTDALCAWDIWIGCRRTPLPPNNRVLRNKEQLKNKAVQNAVIYLLSSAKSPR